MSELCNITIDDGHQNCIGCSCLTRVTVVTLSEPDSGLTTPHRSPSPPEEVSLPAATRTRAPSSRTRPSTPTRTTSTGTTSTRTTSKRAPAPDVEPAVPAAAERPDSAKRPAVSRSTGGSTRGTSTRTTPSSASSDSAKSSRAKSGRTSTRASSAPPRLESELIEAAVEAIGGATPLAFMDEQLAAAATSRLTRAVLGHPPVLVKRNAALLAELSRVVVGASKIEPKADKRFADETFQRNPVYRRVAQGYLAWSRSLYDTVDDLDLDEKSKLRSRFVTGVIAEALAPTNALLGNPAALREARASKGASLRAGLRHALHDLRHNGGLPSMVDTRPFVIGENVAATPGAVVFRNEVLELLRYAPTTPRVFGRPVVIVPPQINKFYVLDLAPGRSLVEAAVAAGQQVFMVSWRNPGPDQRDWNMDTYVTAVLDGIDVARDLTGSDDVNLLGVCAGGITTAALLGHLAALGDERVHAASFLVTAFDWSVPSTVATFASGPAVAAATQRSQSRGILAGRDLAKLFAWLRPNDLIWNYWVNNYLLGKNPPAFDILAWNVDDTNLPAALHADFLQLASRDLLAEAGGLTVNNTPVDLSKVELDAYVVGGETDHIIPWDSARSATHLFAGDVTFVLGNSGHIQTLVCPDGNPKSRFFTTGDDLAEVDPATVDADTWRATAQEHTGSWWPHWLAWLGERSGSSVVAPKRLGNRRHPVSMPAPGTYVHG